MIRTFLAVNGDSIVVGKRARQYLKRDFERFIVSHRELRYWRLDPVSLK